MTEITIITGTQDSNSYVAETYSDFLKSPAASKMYGLKMNVIGSSSVMGVSNEQPYNFIDYIKDNNGLDTIRKYGASGRKLSGTNGTADTFSAMDNDADIVVSYVGTNDYSGQVALGTADDTTISTFYGSCNVLYSGLMAKYPTALILIMLQTHRDGDTGTKTNDLSIYHGIQKEVAQKWGLPILDMMEEYGANPNVTESKTAYIPDGLHSNLAGNERIARIAANRLTGLL